MNCLPPQSLPLILRRTLDDHRFPHTRHSHLPFHGQLVRQLRPRSSGLNWRARSVLNSSSARTHRSLSLPHSQAFARPARVHHQSPTSWIVPPQSQWSTMRVLSLGPPLPAQIHDCSVARGRRLRCRLFNGKSPSSHKCLLAVHRVRPRMLALYGRLRTSSLCTSMGRHLRAFPRRPLLRRLREDPRPSFPEQSVKTRRLLFRRVGPPARKPGWTISGLSGSPRTGTTPSSTDAYSPAATGRCKTATHRAIRTRVYTFR